MSLEEQYDLPDDFAIERADDMERVEAADGTALYVLVSRTTGERQLVHADIVEYDGVLEHPAVGGLAGFLGILAALVTPVVIGILASGILGGSVLHIAGGVFVGGVVGVVSANVCLDNTMVGEWLWRFLEWYDVKHIVETRGDAA